VSILTGLPQIFESFVDRSWSVLSMGALDFW
jgi:hypothetical protein